MKWNGLLALLITSGLVVACAGSTPVGPFATGGESWQGIIKIGLVAPFSGSLPSNALDLLAGARAAADQINRQGGVAGYRIELLVADERNPATPNDVAQDSDVVAVLGHLLPEAATVGPIYARAGLPWLSTAPIDQTASAAGVVYPLVADQKNVDGMLARTLSGEASVSLADAAAAVASCRAGSGPRSIEIGTPAVDLICGGDSEQVVASLDSVPPGGQALCVTGCDTPNLGHWFGSIRLQFATPLSVPNARGSDWTALGALLPAGTSASAYTAVGYDGVRVVAGAIERADRFGKPSRTTVGRTLSQTDETGLLGRYGPKGAVTSSPEIHEGAPDQLVAAIAKP